jgi:phospholipase C
VSPTSVSQVGHSDPAGTMPSKAINHQYDLSWFNKTLTAGDLPSVSFLKAPEYEDGHAGYSDPLDEQRFIVGEINAIETSSAWPSTAIVIAYDDSDGWYDHQIGPIIRPSQDTADSLSGAGKCGNVPNPLPSGFQNDRCGVGPRTPLLVISPWARQNFVDNSFTEQASITRFIEDNWGLGRIGNHSADASAGSLDSAFDFNQSFGHAPAIIMNETNGEITQTIPATPPATASAPSEPTPVSSSPPTTATAPDVPASSPSAAGASGGKAAASSTATVVKLPRVTCSHRTAKTAIRLTCTTRGGSSVPTLMRARLLRGRRLVANRAVMVRRDRVRFSLPLMRARSGRYTIRLTVDAAGRVGSSTRYVRVG